jgi:histidinol-phosphatase (PHP family)
MGIKYDLATQEEALLKIVSDYHVHTSFSGDCSIPPRTMIDEAISRGIRHLCLTDHMDYNFTDGDVIFEFDPQDYFRRLLPLKEQYKEQIDLCIGIELGLQPYLSMKHHNLVFSYPFDFVLGSIHLVHYQDPYYPSFFKGREESEAYLDYFECALQNLESYSNFDSFGHLDYVVRYGPNQNRNYTYDRYREILDEILRALVKKDIGLEINTGGYRYGLDSPNPCREIILRYRELGGKIITLGSDAHDPRYLAHYFDRVAELLKSCGYSSYYIFHNRKPEEIGL